MLLDLKQKGYNNNDIAKILNRTEVSISIKYKRLHKKDGTYNKKHVLDKYKTNDEFINIIKPDSLLDVYAGDKYYSKFNIKKYITNDKDKTKETDFNLEAFNFLSNYYNCNFDIVDLDPFGTAFDCFDLAIKIANKGLIITFGEIGHKRFKRLDFVSDRYLINDLEEDWYDKFIDYIQKRGKIYKKIITPVFIKKWNNIGRIYFKVEKYKEISQWNNNK